MNSYSIFLNAHKGIGYLLLVLVAVFVISLLVAMFTYSGNISKLLRKSTKFNMIVFHLQWLVGVLLLAFFSPGFKTAMSNGTLMSDSANRHSYVEHPVAMIIAAMLMTIINKYVKTNEKLSLKIVAFGLIATALFAYAFPWARVFGS